ncbi:unnamed protein product [Porites lobata]|uniref:L-fucose kinase n=1 Tax=Porites lobata TaxID=104759 RepID=A0ABN8RCP6_9CNID|nr:unnamed protein product [Porites lobata]
MEGSKEMKCSWGAIVLTCRKRQSAFAFQRELEILQNKGFIEKDVLILTLEDPKGGVGSGGATLNALLVVTEHLSAKAGFGVVTQSVLKNARILIMHMGWDFPLSSCGWFFNTLPAKHNEKCKESLCDSVVSNFDYVLTVISATLSVNSPPGVWICSSHMLPSIAPDARIDWEKFSNGITVILSPGDVNYAKDHGVAKLGKDGKVKDIIFRESEEKIRSFALENGKVPLVSGTVFMDIKSACKVLSLHVFHPLDACTYFGLDNGADPIQLSMIFDILLCLAEDVTESAFVEGERSGSYGRYIPVTMKSSEHPKRTLMRNARAMLWQRLRGVELKGVLLENGTFDYSKPSAECYRRQMLDSIEFLSQSGVKFDFNNHTHVSICKVSYVTRDESQQRFLAQHSVAILSRHCFEWFQHCSNIAMLCCAKCRRCISSCVKLPSRPLDSRTRTTTRRRFELKKSRTRIVVLVLFLRISRSIFSLKTHSRVTAPTMFSRQNDAVLRKSSSRLRPRLKVILHGTIRNDAEKPFLGMLNKVYVCMSSIKLAIRHFHVVVLRGRVFSKILRKFLPFCNFAELTSFLSRFLLAVAILLFQNCTPIPESSVVINSIVEDGIKIGENSVISNCHLKGDLSFGSGSILIGISSKAMKDVPSGVTFPNDLCAIHFNVDLGDRPQRVLVVLGALDDLQTPFSSENSTYCNKPWQTFFDGTGISPNELWFGVPEQERSLINAKLFPTIHCSVSPNEKTDEILWLSMIASGFSKRLFSQTMDVNENVFSSSPTKRQRFVYSLGRGLADLLQKWRSSIRLSLQDILSLLDLNAEFDWKRRLWFEIGKAQAETTLRDCKNDCLLPFFRSCVQEGFAKDILKVLDQVACSTSSPGVAARTLACIADVLGAMAGERAGLRSGPARNESWMDAFQCLEKGDIPAGVNALAEERNKWLERPDLLIRAARHYEGAEQILRRKAVFTSRQFFQSDECEPVPKGHWVIAEAPARIDLSGCWTDTPPVTYEHGGAVLTVAVNLNGKKVTGAKVRKISELEIVLVIHSGQHNVRVVCSELTHLENYTQPHAPGALLKACFCLLDIVTLPSSEPLSAQLQRKYQAGFELHTWSTAPQGSGLGTSSILAGAILAALLRVTDRTASLDSLIHAVMIVEQMLTTGGGWQDNAGGLVPGFKMTRSQASLPLKVEVEPLNLSETTVDAVTKRLLCLFSGKPRLAKNLLQDVVRNWYARFPHITENADNLITNAEEAVEALKTGNVEKLGACMNCYRKQKCIMAPGTEPDAIRDMMEALDPFVLGQTLTGAGGGGFLVLITKETNMADKIRAVIEEKKASDEFIFYDVSVDWDGLTVRVEEPSQ